MAGDLRTAGSTGVLGGGRSCEWHRFTLSCLLDTQVGTLRTQQGLGGCGVPRGETTCAHACHQNAGVFQLKN